MHCSSAALLIVTPWVAGRAGTAAVSDVALSFALPGYAAGSLTHALAPAAAGAAVATTELPTVPLLADSDRADAMNVTGPSIERARACMWGLRSQSHLPSSSILPSSSAIAARP